MAQPYVLWIMVIPLVSGIIALLLSRTGKLRDWFSVVASLVTLILLTGIMRDALAERIPVFSYTWSQALDLALSFRIDSLGFLFSLIAALIGFCTILFSVRDLDGERDLGIYYMWMLIFVGSMIGLVFSNDFITFFVFWELVSLCSWGLIGFWNEKPASALASMKAFLMTHIASLPLLLAIISLYFATGSFSIPIIISRINEIGASPLVIGAAILFIIAIVAKSAQIPFHTWLLNAMEAPTPVSALLHAATMVKAGVFLAARMFIIFSPLFVVGSSWFLFFASLGILSMLIAIHMALIEKDIKRVLAYSTISHIGYIMLGIGIGTSLGIAGGFFHFINHAVFKACLFLCAGSIIFRVGTRNIEEMGGLAKKMPITAIAFLIAAFSASGVPPFNGFASKLMIYEAALTAGGPYAGIYVLYCFLAIYVSAVTLAVFMKLGHSVFFGQLPSKFKEIKESPLSMVLPLILLAGGCIFLGVFPQISVNALIFPALQSLDYSVLQPTITWLGYSTVIGSYQASLIAVLLAGAFGIGGLIYLVGVKTVPPSPVPVKYRAMIGGEDPPLLKYEDTKVSSLSYSQNLRSMFKPIFQISNKGGFDIIWINLAKTMYRLSSILSKVLNSKKFILLVLVIVAGLIINLATYNSLNTFILNTGILLILVGSLTAIAQSNLVGVLVWAAISWIGRILIEFGTSTTIGKAGGILDLFNSIIILVPLALTILAVKKAVGTSNLLELGGLVRKMPLTAVAFLISGFALAGVPPLSGWWSEYHLFMAAVEHGPILGITVILASAFTITFILRAFNQTFYGKTTLIAMKGRESTLSVITICLAILCVVIGLYPDLVLMWIYSLI